MTCYASMFGAILITLLSQAIESTAQSTLCQGIVAQYLFDGNLDDSGPNKLHARNGGTTAITFDTNRMGQPDKCALFTGRNWAIVNDDPRLRLKMGTISCWFKTTTTSASSILYKTNMGSNMSGARSENYSVGWYRQGDSAVQGPHCAIKYNSNCAPGKGWKFAATNDSTYSFANDQWHHMVATWDSSQMALWLDGRKISNTAIPGIFADTCAGSPLLFGRDWNNNNRSFLVGSIDDIEIWNRVLTDAEKMLLWQGKSCGNECSFSISSDSILGYRKVETHQVVTYALRNNPAYSYRWIASGGYMLGESTNHFCDVIWGYDKFGSVCCIVSDSVCSDTVCITTTIAGTTTGGIAGDDIETPTMSVKPNPAADMIDISTALGEQFARYELIDVTGVVVQRTEGIAVRMSVADVAPGVYHIVQRDTMGNIIGMQRVVVKR